ncbi:MAG: sigma-54-dependent Fis family transcriptional regulator, partial [Deltaproteobacteria bacterium]|nr:sigma-54-dependent Fis family transcriptional regulator [Deltaproteobacteria bacterium]
MTMQERPQVLIVDDEEQMLLAMEAVLRRLDVGVTKCSSGSQAFEAASRAKPDLIVTDMKMPEMTGLELLAKVRESDLQVPVVLITAYGTINQAVEAMRNGAFDFITKPFSAEDLERVVGRALKPAKRTTTTLSAPRTQPGEPKKNNLAIVTGHPQFKQLLEIAATIAQSDASVLIQGESGTGKELIARLVHQSSRRGNGPFVAVNCAALPGNLLESELFGHERGSFTGAVGQKIGKFELAQGGTILLDEISEMEPVLQAKLLRVLQEREVDRVGGARPIPIDVRVVATTNRDIRDSVKKGEFREDLYYRLSVVPLYIPALRERGDDIKLLAEHFIRRYSGDRPKKYSPALLERLTEYSWPG